MIAILTSSIGGSTKVDGRRIPTVLCSDNGLLEQMKKHWKDNARVLMISADPSDYDVNDSIISCQKEAFRLSDLHVSQFELCDNRSRDLIEKLNEFDVILLVGGHVPTQNMFMKDIGLKEKMTLFSGMVIAWSAGSMNSAEIVYAQPELEGEAIDKSYNRFLTGLGVTKKMIIPHFQEIRDDILDGKRVIEDITYSDSIGREFIALNDGSYIVSDHGVETVYGEAYMIANGKQKKLCTNDSFLIL